MEVAISYQHRSGIVLIHLRKMSFWVFPFSKDFCENIGIQSLYCFILSKKCIVKGGWLQKNHFLLLLLLMEPAAAEMQRNKKDPGFFIEKGKIEHLESSSPCWRRGFDCFARRNAESDLESIIFYYQHDFNYDLPPRRHHSYPHHLISSPSSPSSLFCSSPSPTPSSSKHLVDRQESCLLAFLLPAPVDHDKDNDVEDDLNAMIIMTIAMAMTMM